MRHRLRDSGRTATRSLGRRRWVQLTWSTRARLGCRTGDLRTRCCVRLTARLSWFDRKEELPADQDRGGK